jgi:hypothetical protein
LQRLADQTGLSLTVCHFPPGTSKWNRVEHRLFSFISSNWRGEPLRDYETVVRLIAGTTTAKGLTVTCRLEHAQIHRWAHNYGRRVCSRESEARQIPRRMELYDSTKQLIPVVNLIYLRHLSRTGWARYISDSLEEIVG